MLFAGVCRERDLITREAREAAGGSRPRLVLYPEAIVEVDPLREVLKGLERLGRSGRRRQQYESNGQGDEDRRTERASFHVASTLCFASPLCPCLSTCRRRAR